MVESNIGSSSCIVVRSEDWFCLEFPKAVEVELTCKGGEIGVFEVLGEDVGGELFNVFDNEGFTVFSPECNVSIAAIDHVVCFWRKMFKWSDGQKREDKGQDRKERKFKEERKITM